MSFQGYQEEVDPQLGHGIPGANGGAKVVQLTQEQLAYIVSSTVSQAVTQQMQQIGNNLPPATAANQVPQNTTAVNRFSHPSNSTYPHSRVIVRQTGWCGARELSIRLERVALRLS